ncbi:MAG: oligosaccharide flippase family protein [Erythrobacter sp.]|nr:oligosaccharide flippase family protein [Erythrobacter sp.]
MTAGTTAANLLSFISLIVLTRILMPEDFGLVAIAAAFAEIVAMITKLSLGSALIQRREVEQIHYDTAWTMSVVRGVLVAVLIAASGPFIAEFYGDPRLSDLLQFLALSPLIWGLMNPKLAVFQRKLDFRQEFILTVTGKVVTQGSALILNAMSPFQIKQVGQRHLISAPTNPRTATTPMFAIFVSSLAEPFNQRDRRNSPCAGGLISRTAARPVGAPGC